MADNSGAEKTLSPLREIVRKRRVLWWTGGVVGLIVLVGGTWLGWFVPLGLVAGALLALALLWKVPQWQVGRVRRLDAKERFDRVNEARKTLATILGGIAFLVGGFFTWQNLNLAREGQITDRFSKAIEQLGAVDASGKNKLEVRLGGIYALERIANESERDHWPIMEVLCTYVRGNAPAPSEANPLTEEQEPEKPTQIGKEQEPKKPTQKNQVSAPTPHPTADIQAILTVLGRRDTKYERENQVLDLNSTDLHGAGLGEAYLYAANLRGANLDGAYLYAANLSRANLDGANLRGAGLDSADLRGANLGWANLRGAGLNSADLRGAFLYHADLRGAHLYKADLKGVVFGGTDLREADLEGADLRLAALFVTDLRDAKGLTQQQIDSAKGDSSTRLPPNLHMPESWKK